MEQQPPVRDTILWVDNPEKPGTVMGFHDGIPVFPSQPLQNGFSGICQTRRELPRLGQFERCVLYKPDGYRTWLAYPDAVGYRCFQMPGVHEPLSITWEQNLRHPDQVISGFVVGTFYARIYVDEKWIGSKPKIGETTICAIRWMKHFPKGMVIGYAIPAYANEIANIGKTGVKVTMPKGQHTVKAKLMPDGTITIVLTPKV